MATAAYSSGRSLSCDSIVGAPPEQRSAEGSASRPSHDYDRQRIDDDEDELIELVDEDDEMEDRKSIEDTTTSNPQSPEKGINQDDFTNSAPKTQAAFVFKLWSMVQTKSLTSLICWNPSGQGFTVFNPTEFSKQVLPQFFKHNNFQSFVRQLNMYGFHKVGTSAVDRPDTASSSTGSEGVLAWEFQHPCFQRDEPSLLTQIKRKSSKPASTPPVPSYPQRKPTLASAAAGGPGSSSSRATAARVSSQVDLPALESRYDMSLRRGSAGGADRRVDGYPPPQNGARRPDTSGSASDRNDGGLSRVGTSGGLSGGVWDSLRAGADGRRSPPPPTSSHGQGPQLSPRATGYSSLARPSVTEESAPGLMRQFVALEGQHREAIERCHAKLVKLEPSPPTSAGMHLPPTPGSVTFGHYPPTTGWPASTTGPPPPSSSTHPPLRSPRPSTSSSSQFFYQRPSLTAESFARGNRPDSRDDSHPYAFGAPGTGHSYAGESAGSANTFGLPRPLSSTAGGYGYNSPRTSWQTLGGAPGSAAGEREREPSRLGTGGGWTGLPRTEETRLPPMKSLLDGPGGEAVIPRRGHEDGPGAGEGKNGLGADGDLEGDARKKIRR